MTFLKCVGVVFGMFVLVGTVFLGPAQRMPRGWAIAWGNIGLLAGTIACTLVIRRIVVAARRAPRPRTLADASTGHLMVVGLVLGLLIASVTILALAG